MRTVILALAVLGLTFVAVPAGAQTVIVNPSSVQFTPSADNATINPLDGLPIVARYELRFYNPAAPTIAVTTQDLAKPTVGSDGTITAAISQVMKDATIAAAKNIKLVARVAAIGQYGNEGLSDPTDVVLNPFGFVGPPGKPTNVVPKK
jgi:hypothetical protein